ncbi:MAG: hypothetical protein GVY13_07420 [Alphaproteobacteria bacterium]|jgi:hypothetical protein|nr:hypothetical protein [Alphaproteobacteria bacterium]
MRPVAALLVLAGLTLAAGLVGPGPEVHAQSAGGGVDYADILREVGAPAGRPSGLLLGLREGDEYRTLFLVHDGASAKIGADLPFLTAPQTDGFLLARPVTVTLAEVCADCPDLPAFITAIVRGRTVDALARGTEAVSGPLREAYDLSRESLHPEGFAYESREQASFIADGAYCAAFDLYGFTGGAHAFAADLRHCIDPGSAGPFDAAEPLRLAGLIAPERLAALRRALADEAAAGRFEEAAADAPISPDDIFDIDTDDPVFRLARRDGRTAMTAVAYGSAPYYLTGTYRVTAALPAGPAPAALARYNPDLPFYAALQAADPGVTDAFLSPGNDLAVILGNGRLLAVRPQDGTVLHGMALPHDAVVVADWAVGEAVARWQAELAGLGRRYCVRLPAACAADR